jgi:homoserine kinase type II
MATLTKLTKKDFENILDNYNIGKYKKHKSIFTGTNTIYKLTTSKGNFILKIYENASLSFIKYQIRLMEFLRNTKVSTPKIIDTKKGKGLLIWKNKRIAIQGFVNGKEVLYANKELAKDMGKKYGILDKTLAKFKEKQNSPWSDEQFKLVKWKINSVCGLDVRKESRNILKEILKLNRKKLRRSLIHRDLCEGNFLTQDNKVTAIIDWDDTREEYTAYEIAIPIMHNLITRREVRKDLIKIFVKEYQKYIKLNNEEKKALYYFAKHRMLSGGSWSYDIIDKHKDQEKELLEWANGCIDKYKVFSKLSLNEFLEVVR